MERKSCKIIHVHFLTTHKNFYFGSVAAIFKKFSEEEIGYSKEYISHALGRWKSPSIQKGIDNKITFD